MRKPTTFFGKVFWTLRNRPNQVWANVRGMLLFYLAALLRKVIPLPGVTLGQNVRLQKNRSLMAEAPYAKIEVSPNCIIYENARIEAYGNGQIHVGADSILGDIRIAARAKVTIGKRFLSSWNVFIEDFEAHPVDPRQRALQVRNMVQNFRPRFSKPQETGTGEAWEQEKWDFPSEEISIGDDVWVGANVTILKGARIGNGTIVATGAVVLRGDYPDHCILAGNPAKLVKKC